MDISKHNAKEILEESFWEEYEKSRNIFYRQLYELNTILYLSEKIIDFPLDVFEVPENQIFFRMVLNSFYDSAILLLTRVYTDQGNKHTLLIFKNKIIQFMKPEFSRSFRKILKESKFDDRVKSIFAKVKEVRDHRIAHITDEYFSGNVELKHPKLDELKVLRDELNSLLSIFSFNTGYIFMPLSYDPETRALNSGGKKTDIEKILDSIARESYILNMPETHPTRWERRRNNIDKVKLELLNSYRSKFGMSNI